MKKTTMTAILVVLAIVSAALTVFACMEMSALWAAIGGFTTAAYTFVTLMSAISTDIILSFVKDEEDE